MLDLLIKNGQVCTPSGMKPVNIGVQNEKIVLLESRATPEAHRVIDASGSVVMPGAIEPHMHYGVYMPFDSDIRSESRCAATGGVTTVLSYYRHGKSYVDFVQTLIDQGNQNTLVDFGLHLGILSVEHIQEMNALYERFGIASFKYYTNYMYQVEDLFKVSSENALRLDAGDLAYIFQKMGRELPSATLCVHCEDMEISRNPLLHKEWDATDNMNTLTWYEKRSPDYAESTSAMSTALLASQFDAKAYIVHTSAGLTVDVMRTLLQYGDLRSHVTMETCPHYLTLNVDSPCGLYAKVNPPIRFTEDSEKLWAGIADGTLNTIGSDHCSAALPVKGGREDIRKVKPGFTGSGLLLPLLISEGYHKRGLSLERIAEITSANPAKVFGLPQKGRIETGCDADFAIVDLDKTFTVHASDLNSETDYSVYEDMELKGQTVMTICRGNVVMEQGEITAPAGTGRYIKRV